MLSATPAPDALRFHPLMADSLRTRVRQLVRDLSEPEGQEEAKEVLRALGEKIVLVPVGDEDRCTRLTIDLHGALAAFCAWRRVSECMRSPPERPERKNPARSGARCKQPRSS